MIPIDSAVIVEIIGFGVFLWVALYLLTRAVHRSALIVVALVGLLAQSAFFASGVLTDTTSDVRTLIALERGFWWTSVLPAAAWFHLSNLIRRLFTPNQHRFSTFAPLDVAVYGLAALLTIVATTTNLLLDYDHPFTAATGAPDLAPGQAYPALMLFLLLTALGAARNFARVLREIPRDNDQYHQVGAQQLRLLVAGACIFFLGALWLVVRFWGQFALSALPGYFCFLAGLMLIGYGAAHFGLLLDGQNIRRDFLYAFTGISLVNLGYFTLLMLVGHLSALELIIMIALVTFTHTTYDWGRQVLDKLFFSQQEQDARAEAREYATALGTAPIAASAQLTANAPEQDEQTPSLFDDEKEFKRLVRRAITALKSPPQLAQSPLLNLALVVQRIAQNDAGDNRLGRAAALREILLEYIEGLRPADARHSTSDAWRFYNVLYVPYVRGLSRKGALAEAQRLGATRRHSGQATPDELEQVFAWVADVDEDTFYKWQRRASDSIADVLWEAEQVARQSI